MCVCPAFFKRNLGTLKKVRIFPNLAQIFEVAEQCEIQFAVLSFNQKVLLLI